MKFGYARVSTIPADRQEQNLALQLDALKKVGCDKIYQEKIIGVSTERPELNKLLEFIREGDTLVIWKLDRLERSIANPIGLISELETRQVGLTIQSIRLRLKVG